MDEVLKKFIDLVEEVVPPLQREMGTEWCADKISRLEKLKKEIKLNQELRNEE